MENFTIEDAKPEDVETMRTIVKNSWLELYPNETYGITIEDLSSIDWYNPEKLDKRRKEINEKREDVHNFVLKNQKNEVVGFCIALKLSSYGEIEGMYVLPELQGKGLGKKLMEKALEWLGSNLDIILQVVVYNTQAIGFYKKMGFEETANKVVFTGTQLPSGKEIPRIEMIKKAQNRLL
ncbi:MAG TPA: GNAT family N-acetyltransferase [Candidatus Paceibacterota bacterium]